MTNGRTPVGSGKNASVSKTDKKRSASASSGAGVKSNDHNCGTCNMLVTIEGVECEICLKWHHYKCHKFNKDSAKALVLPGIHWYCPQCDHVNLNTIESKIEKSITDAHAMLKNSSDLVNSRFKLLEEKLDSTLADLKASITIASNNADILESSSPSASADFINELQPLSSPSEIISKDTYSSIVKQNTNTSRVPRQNTGLNKRPNQASFNPDNCVVIHNFKNKSLAVNHIAIRHSISNLLDQPVIDFINLYDKNIPKLMVQFEKSSSITEILEKWNPAKELCEIRQPQKLSFRPEGICFGVPRDISETEMLDYVKTDYPLCQKAKRFMSKTKTPTGTVKLIFENEDELSRAIKDGIYIQQLCLKLVIERAKPPGS